MVVAVTYPVNHMIISYDNHMIYQGYICILWTDVNMFMFYYELKSNEEKGRLCYTSPHDFYIIK